MAEKLIRRNHMPIAAAAIASLLVAAYMLGSPLDAWAEEMPDDGVAAVVAEEVLQEEGEAPEVFDESAAPVVEVEASRPDAVVDGVPVEGGSDVAPVEPDGSDKESEKPIQTGLTTEDGHTVFIEPDGTKAKGWKNVGGAKYYFDSEGRALTGVKSVQGKLYCFDSSGVMKSGWYEWADGSRGYFPMGSDGLAPAVTGWQTLEGKRYWFDPSTGKCALWNRQIDGKWYYFNGNGHMVTGFVKGSDDGRLRLFGSDGVRYSGWYTENGKKKYYFSPSDGKSVQWNQKIDGKWYYFDGNSEMVTGIVRGNDDGLVRIYDINTGVRRTGWVTFAWKKYYIDPATEKSVRWNQKIDGKWYYFNGNSEMVTGMVTGNNDGLKLYFNPDTGVRMTGWQTIGGQRYYFDPTTGKSCQWNKTIDGKLYYFNQSSQMVTGWVKKSNENAWLYYYKDGGRATGTQTIDGFKYTFDSNGLTRTKPITMSPNEYTMYQKAQKYTSNTSYLILINSKTHKVGVFRGSYNNWRLDKYWDCTTGASGSPTVKGSYKVGIKMKSFGSGYTCWYATQFRGNYLFHSVLYQPGSMSRIQDGRLGISASHGCVRLSLANAKWIYNNVPKGTRVISY